VSELVFMAKEYKLPFRLAEKRAGAIVTGTEGQESRCFGCFQSLRNKINPLFVGDSKYRYGDGRCVQGNNSRNGTHLRSLRYAFDFKLTVGSAVVAAKDGIVVAACEYYNAGGMDPVLKARSNFVVLRHLDGLYSRYYHLAHDGVVVKAGDAVVAGQTIAKSGNTGYTSGPHLHFDVVDVCPLETLGLELYRGGEPSREKVRVELPDIFLRTCAAGFSGRMPKRGEGGAKCTGRLVWAEPRTAVTALTNPEQTKGNVVLVKRCKDIDFIDKCAHVQSAGGIAMIVVNYEDGPTLHSMAGKGKAIHIPALMVTSKYGDEIDKLLCLNEALPLQGEVFLSDHFHFNDKKDDIGGCFAAMTVPVKFQRQDFMSTNEKNQRRRRKRKEPSAYAPKVGHRPPKDVLWSPILID
jgi:hypothetical protein